MCVHVSTGTCRGQSSVLLELLVQMVVNCLICVL